ncbi:hypothetical protein L7F22_022221 [Adiantum nelumboides]|nr:hypothetical protein [Adiantum nelumboides]
MFEEDLASYGWEGGSDMFDEYGDLDGDTFDHVLWEVDSLPMDAGSNERVLRAAYVDDWLGAQASYVAFHFLHIARYCICICVSENSSRCVLLEPHDQVNETLAILENMEKNGCVPNVVTYNSLIDGLFKFKDVGNALAMLTHMEKRGRTPNVCCVNRDEFAALFLCSIDLLRQHAEVGKGPREQRMIPSVMTPTKKNLQRKRQRKTAMTAKELLQMSMSF